MRQSKPSGQRTNKRAFHQPRKGRRLDESTALVEVFDDMDEGVYVADPENHEILYANGKTKKDFGRYIEGKQCYEALQGLEKPCDFCTNRFIFGKSLGKSYIWEFHNLKNKRWYRCTDKAIRWHDGKMVRYEMAIDIHDRKVAEEALRRSEEKYRYLVENIPEVIYTADNNGIVTYVSPAIERLTGFTAPELVGRHFSEFVFEEDAGYLKSRYGHALEGQRSPTEYRMLKKSGGYCWVSTFSRPIREGGGGVGLYGVISDVTAYKVAEAALREREKELTIKTKHLEEANTALRVLLDKREKDKEELEEKILVNLKELVNPYLDKLKATIDDKKERSCLDILESNLGNLTSSFSRNLQFKYLNLTPTELRIAGFIRDGSTTKEMADLMNLSPRTIESHRKSIRRKMGLTARKRNLRTKLIEIG